MEFQKLIESRKSIRKFDTTRKVDETTIKEIIKAATLSPSWKNSQTARYYVITSEKLLSTFRHAVLPSFNIDNTATVPALIITTFVKDRAGFDRNGVPDNEGGNGWGYYDLGIHNQSFVLKARDLGLDTLIMGIRDADKTRELLSIPENEIIVSIIGLGYADQNPTAPPKKSVDEITKFF